MNYNVVRGMTQAFDVYHNNDGSYRLLGIATVDLPEFSNKGDDLNGTGILGDINFPVMGSFESQTITLHYNSNGGDWSLFASPDAHNLSIRSAEQNYDSATGKNLTGKTKIDVVGKTKSQKMGKLEQASGTDSEVELEIFYYKLTVDDVEKIELDKTNQIFKVNGVDVLAEMHDALGH